MLQEACRRARHGIGREEPKFEIGRNTVRGGKTVYGAASISATKFRGMPDIGCAPTQPFPVLSKSYAAPVASGVTTAKPNDCRWPFSARASRPIGTPIWLEAAHL
jgi:hypothetical protein